MRTEHEQLTDFQKSLTEKEKMLVAIYRTVLQSQIDVETKYPGREVINLAVISWIEGARFAAKYAIPKKT